MKSGNFSTLRFYHRQNRPRKCVWEYSRKKKILSTLSKQQVKTVKNLGFFHDFGFGFHLFNIGIPLFFLGNIGEKNVFYNILERKKPFSAIKTRFSKRRKIKNRCFWSKNWTFFDLFFLSKIGQKNGCYDILERKHPFLGSKKKSKTRKNWNFS